MKYFGNINSVCVFLQINKQVKKVFLCKEISEIFEILNRPKFHNIKIPDLWLNTVGKVTKQTISQTLSKPVHD